MAFLGVALQSFEHTVGGMPSTGVASVSIRESDIPVNQFSSQISRLSFHCDHITSNFITQRKAQPRKNERIKRNPVRCVKHPPLSRHVFPIRHTRESRLLSGHTFQTHNDMARSNYFIHDKIIMLLSRKYGILCTDKRRNAHDKI